MMNEKTTIWGVLGLAAAAWLSVGCNPPPAPSPNCSSGSFRVDATGQNLEHRAYVVSRDSGDITVIDLDSLQIAGVLDPCGKQDHMLELSPDFTKAYVDSTETDETIVFDARTLEVKRRIPIAGAPTHLSMSPDGKVLAVVAEADNAVSFIDPERDVEVKRLDGFFTPHFVRFAPDGRYAYVANLGAHHITRLDLKTLSVDGEIVLEGFQGSPKPTPAPNEGGFADVQIDKDGILYAAHAATGRVLVYDTKAQKKLSELAVGQRPWIVYAEHPFANVRSHIVPNFGDQTVSVIDGLARSVTSAIDGADRESFGVNYSSLVPDHAFVMNRFREEIAVVDTARGQQIARIPVGGNTETASTTADGKWIVAAVSSANRVVVIDARTNKVVKTFDNVGRYPWSVTIPLGQNYCH